MIINENSVYLEEVIRLASNKQPKNPSIGSVERNPKYKTEEEFIKFMEECSNELKGIFKNN